MLNSRQLRRSQWWYEFKTWSISCRRMNLFLFLILFLLTHHIKVCIWQVLLLNNLSEIQKVWKEEFLFQCICLSYSAKVECLHYLRESRPNYETSMIFKLAGSTVHVVKFIIVVFYLYYGWVSVGHNFNFLFVYLIYTVDLGYNTMERTEQKSSV